MISLGWGEAELQWQRSDRRLRTTTGEWACDRRRCSAGVDRGRSEAGGRGRKARAGVAGLIGYGGQSTIWRGLVECALMEGCWYLVW